MGSLSSVVQKLFFATVVAMVCGTAFANNSSNYDKDGATVIPIESKSIRMEKETVMIKADHDEDGKWLADCEFVFVNTSDLEEPVTMGYPDWLNSSYDPKKNKQFWDYFNSLPEKTRKYYEDGDSRVGHGYGDVYFEGYKKGILHYLNTAWNLRDLEVFVNGKRIKTVHKPIEIKLKVPAADRKKFSQVPYPPVGAHIWTLRFKPNEKMTVRITFSFSGLSDIAGYQQVAYLLQTGALWADTIGTADIFWNTAGRRTSIAPGSPPLQSTENDVMHWHFENYKPTEDIVLYAVKIDLVNLMKRAFRSREYEGNTRDYTAEDMQGTEDMKRNVEGFGYYNEIQMFVKTLRNEIYARHGATFKSDELQLIFSACDWYKPNKLFSESWLNDYEQKNIQFILNYEKEQGW